MAGENGVSSAVVKALGTYLMANMTGLSAVFDDFPTANQKLDYPSITVFTRTPLFQPGALYVISKSSTPDVNNNFTITKSIGDYVFKLQIDIWVGSKFARHAIYEQFFRVMNPDDGVSGLTLTLANYFNEKANYLITGFDFTDSEVGSQTQEWRVMVDITVDCRAVVQGLAHIMQTFENTLETPSEISVAVEAATDLTI